MHNKIYILYVLLSLCSITNVFAGSSPHYRWDESRNPLGPHRCQSSMECTGLRRCSQFGWCQDPAPPPPPPPPSRHHHTKGPHDRWNESRNPRNPHRNVKGPYYIWDESKNRKGPHRCSSSMECRGNRTCSMYGWCQG